MLSRTSARQQRMRQQTLNEERSARSHDSPITSTERRPSGCNLIYSSPTPSSNYSASQTQQNTPGSGAGQSSRSFGTGALLASLNGSNDQQQIMASPMESCFANIVEDQGSDSFDLNNITPSINLPDSVAVSGELLVCRSRPSCSNQANTHLDTGRNLPQTDNDFFRSKASTSCPAGMQDSLMGHHLTGTAGSPLGTIQQQQHSNQQQQQQQQLLQFNCPTNGSGGSLGAASIMTDSGSATTGLGMSLMQPTSSTPANRHSDDPRAAWVRDRTKKDSHNRIERKRRDYINCQITELGNLLPEEMFRDGECKKNKGSILKNSVEFICLLRAELSQMSEVREETDLAAKLIEQLVKRIQDLESMVASSPGLVHVNLSQADYQRSLQEWVLLHERNLQIRLTHPSPIFSYHHPLPTDRPDASSPGLSSIATEDMLAVESPNVVVGSAPVPSAPLCNSSRLNSGGSPFVTRPSVLTESSLRLMRTRCTSLTVSDSNAGSHLLLLDNARRQNTPSTTTQQQPDTTTTAHLVRHNSPQTRLLTSPHHIALIPASRSATNQPWPPQQQQPAIRQNQNQLSSLQHLLLTQHRQSAKSRPVALSPDHEDITCQSGLSASLPVQVNPMLCGLQQQQQEQESKANGNQLSVRPYTMDPDEVILKTEPLSEVDQCSSEQKQQDRYMDLCYTESGFPTSSSHHFDPVLGSAVHFNNNNIRMSSSSLGTARNQPFMSGLVTDSSPIHVGFESNDFQFDDVPME